MRQAGFRLSLRGKTGEFVARVILPQRPCAYSRRMEITVCIHAQTVPPSFAVTRRPRSWNSRWVSRLRALTVGPSILAAASRTQARSGMLLYHWRGEARNFGDELNLLLWPRLLPGLLDDDPAELFLGIGSVLDARHARDAVKLVAGAGYGGYAPLPVLDARWVIHWVRGPRTARQLGLDTAYGLGDPAMLLPQAGWGRVGGGDTVAFMPHFESAERGAWAGSGRGGRHRTDRSARRSGRDHRRDRTLPGAAQRGDARRDRCRCAARAVDRGSAARAGASREMARLGRHAGPSRRVSPAGRLRRCGSGCVPRRSPRCIPATACWTGSVQRLGA